VRAGFDTQSDRRRLRWLLGAFFLALAVPAFVLVQEAFKQLDLDAFRRQQLLAEEFAQRVDQGIAQSVRSEDARGFADYGFLIVAGDPQANFLQPSPLAAFPVQSAVPGVLGYFQIDAAGVLSTPLLPSGDVDPAAYGVTPEQRAERVARAEELRRILAATTGARVAALAGRDSVTGERTRELERDAVPSAAPVGGGSAGTLRPAAPPPVAAEDAAAGQSALEGLFELADSSPARASAPAQENAAQEAFELASPERAKRLEQSSVPEPATQRITTFASEVDPLQFGRLDTGHLVMFRNVWRNGQRFVQGAVIDTSQFLQQAIGSVFDGVALSAQSSLRVGYRGGELAFLPARAAGGTLSAAGAPLYETRLSPPLADLELAFFVATLPPAPGFTLLVWVSVVLTCVLLGGFFVMYRFGLRQITLRRQQQDFVSAVSHELKTPLTSIRMYGEMLQAGWASEEKKRTYYAYIAEESERLSRLIENVLALARMNRGEARLELANITVGDLLDMVQAKVATALERAGFTLSLTVPAELRAATLRVDRDAFAQIFINLIDNALKFAARAERKEVAIAVRRDSNGMLFCVRDFGPGVPRGKMKKLFELFYRPEDELTRTTAGTGIGLGLVRQLATAMQAAVDVRNCDPGAEFRLLFPLVKEEK
jgi:signal transduction histidine kinase